MGAGEWDASYMRKNRIVCSSGERCCELAASHRSKDSVLRLAGGGGSDGVIFGNVGEDADPEKREVNLRLWDAAVRPSFVFLSEFLVRSGILHIGSSVARCRSGVLACGCEAVLSLVLRPASLPRVSIPVCA